MVDSGVPIPKVVGSRCHSPDRVHCILDKIYGPVLNMIRTPETNTPDTNIKLCFFNKHYWIVFIFINSILMVRLKSPIETDI